jgi:hypothetical protein
MPVLYFVLIIKMVKKNHRMKCLILSISDEIEGSGIMQQSILIGMRLSIYSHDPYVNSKFYSHLSYFSLLIND